MDSKLRNLQRKAQSSPEDPIELWQYIRALERLAGISENIPEPLVICLTDGKLDGDSIFDGTLVPYQEGDTFVQVLAKVIQVKGIEPSETDYLEYFHDADTGWVVPMSLKEAVETIYENAPTGNDSSDYAVNATVKGFISGQAIKTVEFNSYEHFNCPEGNYDYIEPKEDFVEKLWEEYEKLTTTQESTNA